ncbi:MAG TPA: hypothetical protein ENG69_04860 [Candidatus Korarchaeota archaeon]|nr:hypothetical protein [Candidatus Korarchaeota archaeon]
MNQHRDAHERIIDEKTASDLRERLEAEMKEPVTVVVIVGSSNAQYSTWTAQLIRELSELSKKILARIVDADLEPDEVEDMGVDPKRTPIILVGPERVSVRYLGAPSGYEAWGFVETIIQVSKRESGLSADTVETLGKLVELGKRVKLQVFVTPSCPYCPHQSLLANRFAIAVPEAIEAETVEAWENPDMADALGVTAVPDTRVYVWEDGKWVPKGRLIGVQPEEKFAVEVVMSALGE